MLNSKKIAIVIVLVVLVFVAVFYWVSFSRPVAVVNGEKITIQDFEEFTKSMKNVKMDKTMRDFVVQQLVDLVLLKQEAVREGLKLQKSEGKLKDTINLANQLYAKKTQNITVSDEEARKYYNEHKNLFCEADIYKISISAPETLRVVEELLAHGEEPRKVAEKYSDTVNLYAGRKKFSELPILQMLAYQKYTPTTKEGKYYVIYWAENKKVIPYENVRNEIKARLKFEHGQKIMNELLSQLRKKAKIKINK